MLTILRQRNFALLWLGQLISTIGNWVLLVGLPFYVYTLTGSVLATGAMFIAQTLPRVLFGSLVGTFVDRWPLKRVMLSSDLLRALILLPLLLLHSREWVWLVYVVAGLELTISLFFDPAKSALIPRLVSGQNLVAANSLDALSTGLTTVIGPSLGGVLLAWLGLTGVVLVDGASYVVSALMIWLIKLPESARKDIEIHPVLRQAAGEMSIWQEWLSGLELVFHQGSMRTLFIVTAIAMIGQGIITVILIVFVEKVLRGNTLVYGWLLTAQGAGSIAGGLLAGYISRFSSPLRVVAFSLGIVGIVVLLQASFPILWLVLILMVIAGIAAMNYVTNAQALLQRSTAPSYQGRIFGSYYNSISLMLMIGMGIASASGGVFGPVLLFELAGVLFLAAAGVAMAGAQQRNQKM
ncbi:MAG TPA: MFS transporter [Ktedonobacteraceae bacterium]|nr:MFS transporter [Ktedonobacteraceae bacterium]